MHTAVIIEQQSNMPVPMEINFMVFVPAATIHANKSLYDDGNWKYCRHFPGFMVQQFMDRMSAETMYQQIKAFGEAYKNYD